VGRIRSAAGSNARRREEGDAVLSGTNVNEAVGHAPSEPLGREGVTAAGHCRSSESMRRIDSFLDSSPNGRKTLSCDPRDFHHGLLARISHHVARPSAREGRQDEASAAWRAQTYSRYIEHDEQAQRSIGGLITCLDRQVVRMRANCPPHKASAIERFAPRACGDGGNGHDIGEPDWIGARRSRTVRTL